MPEFPERRPLSPSPARGGLALQPDPAGILRACEDLGPLFLLFRSDACIFGSVADPLWHLEKANVHLAASGAITLNLAPRRPCAAFSYVESGPHGGFIDAVEFCDAQARGFLKICRMDATDHVGWRSLVAMFQAEPVPPARIAAIRKTNHLQLPVEAGGPPSPAETVIGRFLECAVETGATLHVTAQASGARGRLVIRPTHRTRVGYWTVLSSDETAFHLAPACVGELRIVTRPHLAQLILLGTHGRFLARILTRDRALLNQLYHIL